MSETPTIATQTAKPVPARRTARERLSLLLWGYMPYVVPAPDALVPLSDPVPEVLIESADPSPEAVALAEYVVGTTVAVSEVSHRALLLRVGRLIEAMSSPEACATELASRRALEILVPDDAVYIDRECRPHRLEDLPDGLRQEVEAAIERAAIERARAAAAGTSG